MSEKKQNFLILFIIIGVFVALLFFANFTYVKNQPGGIDFLHRWYPTRLVAFEGYENIYSQEVEYQVELFRYGRKHGDDFPGMFSYPYHTMFVFLPFALIKDFSLARATWMTVMELAHIGIILLTLKTIGYKPAKNILLGLILFSLFSAEFLQPLIDGNPSSLAALFVILSLFLISKKSDYLAGMFLAFSTIKPQLSVLFFALIWIWSFSRKRWGIIYSSSVALFVLFGISFLSLPNWVSEFIRDTTAYPGAATPSTPRTILAHWMPVPIANIIAWALTILSIYILFQTWRRAYGKEFPILLWAMSITFAIMPLTGITSAKSNYVAMLPGVILLLQYGAQELKMKDILLGSFLMIWIGLGWLFFYLGRTWVIGDNLIYFIDFYPMPIILLTLYYVMRPSKDSKTLEFYEKSVG
jgi:hypothetical protein